MRTVYIIGAGASHEVGLPVGSTLKAKIAKALDIKHGFGSDRGGNQLLWRYMERHFDGEQGKLDKIADACNYISQNMPLTPSIDNLLDLNRQNKELSMCGKVAIIESILEAERDSKLYINPNKGLEKIDFKQLQDSWYLKFFHILTENCEKTELPKRLSSLTLIVFNYDRCIEHFLFHALGKVYRLSPHECAELLINNLKVIHPYGSVGALPWQVSRDSPSIEFGKDISYDFIINASDSIKTFSEIENVSSEVKSDIMLSMEHADRIAFLGFAFHKMNMELLSHTDKQPYEPIRRPICYATAYGLSTDNQRIVDSKISEMFSDNIDTKLENMECVNFLEHFSLALSFADW